MDEFLEKIVAHWKTLEAVRAIALRGSRATSDSEGGDWDLAAYVDRIPDEPSRRILWESCGSPVRADAIIYGGGGDRFSFSGNVFELDYFRVQDMAHRIEQVMVEGNTTPASVDWCTPVHVPEVVCADIQACKPLWDPQDLIKGWKGSVAEYPSKFRLNILRFVLFEMRFKLKGMHRAAELRDIGFFHMSLSHLCFCLLRMLYSLNGKYFPQAKRAMSNVSKFAVVPTDCGRRMEELLRSPLSEGNLNEIFIAAKQLVKESAELAAQQGENEKKAIHLGLADWPDVEPLH